MIDETAVQAKIDAHSYETILENLLSIYRSAEKGQVDHNE